MQKTQITLLASLLVLVYARVEFTNVKCASLDKKLCDFEYCFLKSVNRTYKYMSLKVKLLQRPMANITINFSLLKKANGYKPFLYNITFDACKYLASTKRNPVIQYFHDFFVHHSNMNHSCPYDHDLFVEKVPASYVNNMVTNILPVPFGEYAFFTTWSAYNIPRATTNVYVKIF